MPAPIPKDKVLEDIQRVADKLGKVPTRREYAEHGEYSEITPRAKCGSWSEAREEAGLDGGPTKNTWIDKQTLKEEIQRVAGVVGESPSQEQFNEHGEYSHVVVCEKFGSWNEAIKEVDLEPYTQDVADSELLSELRRLAKELERIPSQADVNRHSGHGVSTYQRRFGQWSTAVREAGFEPRTVGPPPGEENGYWKGGYEPYYGPNWAEQRRAARDRDGYCCVACGMSDGEHKDKLGWELEVHHIKPFAECEDYFEANDLENLITLCRTHHREYEELPTNECEKLRS